MDAREVDQQEKGEKTPADPAKAFSSFPMVVDSAADAAAAGTAKDCAASSTAASVAFSVDAAVSHDDIAGTDGSVPGMDAAASSLLSSGEAPQTAECVQAVATCNIDANQNQAPAKSKTSNSKN